MYKLTSGRVNQAPPEMPTQDKSSGSLCARFAAVIKIYNACVVFARFGAFQI
jgi:hypothetical protein